jgi:hypothetical protein
MAQTRANPLVAQGVREGGRFFPGCVFFRNRRALDFDRFGDWVVLDQQLAVSPTVDD